MKYSFPLAIVKHLDSLYGREATESILNFYNTEKYTDITVNTLKNTPNEYLNSLSELGVEAEQNEFAKSSMRIPTSVNPERLPGFEDGFFFVQDRASAIAAQVLDPGSGDLIIDVCSAPGGKSFAAAINASGKGEVHSFDLHESKLSLIRSGAERLSLDMIKVDCRDALDPDSTLFGKADRVICDAPCSGLGVLGKKPDLRYKDLDSIESLADLQYSILSASSKYLKEGGIMVYSTCTLNPSENEDIVNRFISEHPDFEITPFTVGNITAEGGMLTLLPHIHHTDGFFMAKIRRKT